MMSNSLNQGHFSDLADSPTIDGVFSRGSGVDLTAGEQVGLICAGFVEEVDAR